MAAPTSGYGSLKLGYIRRSMSPTDFSIQYCVDEISPEENLRVAIPNNIETTFREKDSKLCVRYKRVCATPRKWAAISLTVVPNNVPSTGIIIQTGTYPVLGGWPVPWYSIQEISPICSRLVAIRGENTQERLRTKQDIALGDVVEYQSFFHTEERESVMTEIRKADSQSR